MIFTRDHALKLANNNIASLFHVSQLESFLDARPSTQPHMRLHGLYAFSIATPCADLNLALIFHFVLFFSAKVGVTRWLLFLDSTCQIYTVTGMGPLGRSWSVVSAQLK